MWQWRKPRTWALPDFGSRSVPRGFCEPGVDDDVRIVTLTIHGAWWWVTMPIKTTLVRELIWVWDMAVLVEWILKPNSTLKGLVILGHGIIYLLLCLRQWSLERDYDLNVITPKLWLWRNWSRTFLRSWRIHRLWIGCSWSDSHCTMGNCLQSSPLFRIRWKTCSRPSTTCVTSWRQRTMSLHPYKKMSQHSKLVLKNSSNTAAAAPSGSLARKYPKHHGRGALWHL